jgi:predicted membrane chloride channel (bestrophin family)
MMNQKEYAAHRGCVPSYINRLVKNGTLNLDEDGKLDPKVCDEILRLIKDPARTVMDDSDDDAEEPADKRGTYNDAALQYKLAQTQVLQLQLRKEAGELVSKAEVDREAFESKRKIRDRLQRLPTQIAGKLVKMTNEMEIQAFLAAQIREVLTELSNAVGTDESE